MNLSISKFAEWEKKSTELGHVRAWLKRIGAQGRRSDVLQISSAHCVPPRFTIAGQYTEGGTNYWESPKEFDQAMQAIILLRFKELSSEAVVLLEKNVAEALVNAEEQITAIRCAIEEAKATAA